MKRIVENVVRLRNAQFRFASEIRTIDLLALCWRFGIGQLRSLRLLIHGHAPWGRFFESNVQVICGRKLRLGKWVKIGGNTCLNAFGLEGLEIGARSGIGAFSRLVVGTDLARPGKGIRIGENVGIGEYAYLGGGGGLTIGDDCIIGQYFSCHPENHFFDKHETLIRQQGTERKGIRIGNNCWIGAKVTVLDGVEIGDGCVIAAGAVVTKSMPANSIVGGVPARVIRSRFSIVSPNKIAV